LNAVLSYFKVTFSKVTKLSVASQLAAV